MKICIQNRAADLRYTLAVVYEPDVDDSHGDSASPDTIRAAAWYFMRGLQASKDVEREVLNVVAALEADREVECEVTAIADHIAKGVINDMHQTDGDDVGHVVESFVAPVDMTVNGEIVKAGTWCIGIVWSPEQFEKIKSGDRTGVSMGGTAVRMADAA